MQHAAAISYATAITYTANTHMLQQSCMIKYTHATATTHAANLAASTRKTEVSSVVTCTMTLLCKHVQVVFVIGNVQ